MVDSSNEGATFVEVGAWFGKSTNHMASKIKESKKNIEFIAVDTWKGSLDEELHQNIVGSFGGDIYSDFIENTILSGNDKSFKTIKDTSENASKQFPNNSIDYIMIDAGHDYDSVINDLKDGIIK